LHLAADVTRPPKWREGALYAVPHSGGTYRILKVLKIEQNGIHVRCYSNVYDFLPANIEESTLYIGGIRFDSDELGADETIGIGHAPVSHESCSSWDVKFIQQSSLSVEELEGYNAWLEGGGGYF
jgi:hypothetical protein